MCGIHERARRDLENNKWRGYVLEEDALLHHVSTTLRPLTTQPKYPPYNLFLLIFHVNNFNMNHPSETISNNCRHTLGVLHTSHPSTEKTVVGAGKTIRGAHMFVPNLKNVAAQEI